MAGEEGIGCVGVAGEEGIGCVGVASEEGIGCVGVSRDFSAAHLPQTHLIRFALNHCLLFTHFPRTHCLHFAPTHFLNFTLAHFLLTNLSLVSSSQCCSQPLDLMSW